MSSVAQEVFNNDDLRRYIFTFYNQYREPTQSCSIKIKNFFYDCITNIQFKLFTFIFYSARAPILSRL
jgi:hypothetical protein